MTMRRFFMLTSCFLIATVLPGAFCVQPPNVQAPPTLAPSATSPSANMPVRIPSAQMSEHNIYKAPVSYPKDAKKAHVSGAVVVKMIVNKQGDVESAEVIS